MSIARVSETTEQLSQRARTLLNQQFRKLLAVDKSPDQDSESEGVEHLSPEDDEYVARLSVAGARRRLRAEWAELKGDKFAGAPLTGVVAFVSISNHKRALALRAALAAMGATVVLQWGPLVTHLVWQNGGDRDVRKHARHLNAYVVKPKWVEACASSNSRVPERSYGTPARPSDPPDPRHLRKLLQIVDKENKPLHSISEDKEKYDTSDESRMLKLRVSTDSSANTSRNSLSASSSNTKSASSRVNTAPRRALPISPTRVQPPASRRKLFTQLDNVRSESDSDLDEDITSKNPYGLPASRQTKTKKKKKKDGGYLITGEKEIQKQKSCVDGITQKLGRTSQAQAHSYYIVLSGMNRAVRKELSKVATKLECCVQKSVSSYTTHVLIEESRRTLAALAGAARGCWVLHADYLRQCALKGCMLPPHKYQLEELKKTATRARIERSALQYRSYALSVFDSLHVSLLDTAEHLEEVTYLLQLCGATILTPEHQDKADVIIASAEDVIKTDKDCVVSRWVSDSIAAGRMRKKRRYLVPTGSSAFVTQS